MSSLDRFAADKLADLKARGILRTLKPTRRLDGLWVEQGGRRLLSFSCNDYLNLSHHPEVKAAAAQAALDYGAGAGASRLVSGDHPLMAELEARLARLKGTEAACVFGSGYLANAGIIPTFVGPGDLVLVDALAHACIWAGASLSRAEVVSFRHNDADHLAELLEARRGAAGRVLVATDGVFSMDGDIAPLQEISALCREHDAWLLVDDAHGMGVLGEGRGTVHALGGPRNGIAVELQMGTLSKALGSYGGYLCASRPVVDLLKTRARTFVFTTGLPPASAAAAIKALDLIEAAPALAARPLANARLFTELAGLPPAQTSIVPVVIGGADAAMAAARRLEAEGFLVVAIRPPTVALGTARLRIAFTAGHAPEDIARLARCVAGLERVAA
jgi:8-amino-7-oxononanoate synthase